MEVIKTKVRLEAAHLKNMIGPNQKKIKARLNDTRALCVKKKQKKMCNRIVEMTVFYFEWINLCRGEVFL